MISVTQNSAFRAKPLCTKTAPKIIPNFPVFWAWKNPCADSKMVQIGAGYVAQMPHCISYSRKKLCVFAPLGRTPRVISPKFSGCVHTLTPQLIFQVSSRSVQVWGSYSRKTSNHAPKMILISAFWAYNNAVLVWGGWTVLDFCCKLRFLLCR